MRRGWGIVILILSFVLMQVCFAYAGNTKVGTTAAQFLKIGVGGRATGMGGAFTGIADDVSALYWNPGGLGLVKNKEVLLTYNSWFQDISHQFLGVGLPVEKVGTIGLGVTMLTVSDLEKRTTDTETKEGDFKSQDMAISLSYGRELNEEVSVGANLKYISQKIDDKSATGFAADLGSMFKTPVDKLTVGLAVTNIGSKIKFVDEGDSLPMAIKVGAGYKLLNDALTVGLDVIYPNDNDISVATGIEYAIKFGETNSLAIRSGYKTGIDTGGMSGLGAGIGILVKQFGIDFTWAPYGDLGDTYRGSLLFKF